MFNLFRRSSSSAPSSASSSSPENPAPGKEEVVVYLERTPDWVDVPLEEFCRKPADFPPTPKVVEPQPPKVVEVQQPPKKVTEEEKMLGIARSLAKEAEEVLEAERAKEAFLSSAEQEIASVKRLQTEARALVLSNRARSKRAKDSLNLLCEFDFYAEEEEEETPSSSSSDDFWLPY